MAKWKKNESLGKALAREGGSIAKGVGKELLLNSDSWTISGAETRMAIKSPPQVVSESAEASDG
jgi:hypothetical protein